MRNLAIKLRTALRQLTLVEVLIAIAILAVLVLLLNSSSKWASSGEIRIPVRVLVFDAKRGSPIANAEVSFFWAPPLTDFASLSKSGELYGPHRAGPLTDVEKTAADGTVTIDVKFTTGASHVRPTTFAHTNFVWVHVKAPDYAEIVIPVRHTSMPSKALRELGELNVPIGLSQTE